MTSHYNDFLIDAAQLHAGDYVVLDATVILPSAQFDGDYRPQSGYGQWLQAHIPGSRHVDMLHQLASLQKNNSFAYPSAAQLQVLLAELQVGPETPLVVYDSSDGFWAARLWWVLRSYGVPSQVLQGGLRAWQQAGLPLSNGEAPALPIPLPQQPLSLQPAYWSDHQQVLNLLSTDSDSQLICALPAAVFNGQAISRYQRRGHIPGSLCLPARTLLDADGRFLPATEIANIANQAGLDTQRPLVIYCGGGISAASLALGLSLAGFTRLSIYDGSLQEWAADPALPLITEE